MLWLLVADIIHTDNPPALNRQVQTTKRMIRIRRMRWSRARAWKQQLARVFHKIFSHIPVVV